MRRLDFRRRLGLWCAAALLLLLAPYATFVIVVQWQTLEDALEHHMQEDLEFALEMLVIDENGVRWRVNGSGDLGYDAGAERWVEVMDLSGRHLFTRGTPEMRRLQATLPAVDRVGFRSLRTADGSPLRVLVQVRESGGVPVILRIGRSEADMRGDFKSLLLAFLIGVPICVIAAGGAGDLVARGALKPLAVMTERARTIGAERLNERLPVHNPNDEIGQLALVFNDTFGRIEEAFERLRRFTADASHELRSPLTALRSVGEVGLTEARSPEAYREIIGSMLEEVDHLSGLVDGLLMLSRADSGAVKLSPERLDLRELARDVTGYLGVLAEERGLDLRLCADGPVEIRGDRLVLRQAAINLLDNAIKYSASGRRVTVAARRQASECRLEVIDEGPGIAPADQPLVFDRFFRGDRARSRDVPGTGLGLAIAQWAVTANGGRIELDSELGRGSRFAIVLPAVA